MNGTFAQSVSEDKSLLILLPVNPSFDEVASGLALFLAFSSSKEVRVVSSSQMRVEFNRLVGVDKITSEIGNKNLTIKFAGYKAEGIEKVSYDILNGEFVLTVMPKEGMEGPRQEQIQVAKSWVSADSVIMVGGKTDTDFPQMSMHGDIQSSKRVHVGIDNLSVSGGQPLIAFVRSASSVSEYVATLIKESGYEYTADIATNLLAGIEERSGNYSSPMVSAETFQTVSDLMKAGGRRLSKMEQKSYPVGAIPALPSLPKRSVAPVAPAPVVDVPRTTDENPPKSWMEDPKIFRGGSGSIS